jgi:hypothetical protein
MPRQNANQKRNGRVGRAMIAIWKENGASLTEVRNEVPRGRLPKIQSVDGPRLG